MKSEDRLLDLKLGGAFLGWNVRDYPVTVFVMFAQAACYALLRLAEAGRLPFAVDFFDLYEKSLLSLDAIREGRHYTIFACYLFVTDFVPLLVTWVGLWVVFSRIEYVYGSRWALVVLFLPAAAASGASLLLFRWYEIELSGGLDPVRTQVLDWCRAPRAINTQPWHPSPLWFGAAVAALILLGRVKVVGRVVPMWLFVAVMVAAEFTVIRWNHGQYYGYEGFISSAALGSMVGGVLWWRSSPASIRSRHADRRPRRGLTAGEQAEFDELMARARRSGGRHRLTSADRAQLDWFQYLQGRGRVVKWVGGVGIPVAIAVALGWAYRSSGGMAVHVGGWDLDLHGLRLVAAGVAAAGVGAVLHGHFYWRRTNAPAAVGAVVIVIGLLALAGGAAQLVFGVVGTPRLTAGAATSDAPLGIAESYSKDDAYRNYAVRSEAALTAVIAARDILHKRGQDVGQGMAASAMAQNAVSAWQQTLSESEKRYASAEVIGRMGQTVEGARGYAALSGSAEAAVIDANDDFGRGKVVMFTFLDEEIAKAKALLRQRS